MSSHSGKLALAGLIAVAGVGCAHHRAARTTETTSQTSTVTTPVPATPAQPNVQPGAPGTEMGTGGAGQYGAGIPSTVPETTTPNSTAVPRDQGPGIQGNQTFNQPDTSIQNVPSTQQNLPTTTMPSDTSIQPGTGGSGTIENKSFDKPKDMNPDNCIRSQVGSPASSDVICDQNKSSDSSMSGSPSSSASTTSSGTATGTASDTSLGTPSSSTGIGGSGLNEDSSPQSTQTKAVKHKKHAVKKMKPSDQSGTGGSGQSVDQPKQDTEKKLDVQKGDFDRSKMPDEDITHGVP